MSWAPELAKFIKGEILTDGESLKHYSQDASIFRVQPQVVVCPKDLDDLKSLVGFVANQREAGAEVSLTPRNAGTCMSGGSLTDSIMVDLTPHFNGVGSIASDQTIEVGAGAYFKQIAAPAEAQGLMFGAYTSSKDLCGIGGMLGNNASGEKSIRFGATTDNTKLVHAVLADGSEYAFGPLTPDQLEAKCQQSDQEGYIYRSIRGLLSENQALIERSRPKVRKNAAGYDLWRVWDSQQQIFNLAHLLIGSQGTLAVITGATLQLVPLPQFTQLVVIGIDNLSRLSEAVQTVLNHHPEGLEVYDQHTYELAKIHMAEVAEQAKAAEGKRMILLAQMSEVTAPRTEQVAKTVVSELEKRGFPVNYIDDETERQAHWQIRRAAFKLLKEHAHGQKRACPFLEDTIVSVTHFGEFVAALEAILSDYDLTYTYHGHIGDGSLRLVPLIDVEAEGAVALIEDLAKRVYDLVIAFDGSISVDHNDGLAKSPYLRAMYGDQMMGLFAEVKRVFDPSNIFNPRKKTGADLGYSMAHLARDNQAGLI